MQECDPSSSRKEKSKRNIMSKVVHDGASISRLYRVRKVTAR